MLIDLCNEMAADFAKTVLNQATRLGVTDKPSIRKAVEYMRILKSKNQVKLSDSAMVTICLDLAATNSELFLEKDTAIRLSGLKKSTYFTSMNNVKKILSLDEPVSIAQLSVQCDCVKAKEMAENLFKKYKESGNIVGDSDIVQYAVAALFTASRIQNLKPSSTLFLRISRLKRAQWKELTDKFFQFAKELKLDHVKITTKHIEAPENNVEMESSESTTEPSETPFEDYEVWKNRILTEAYAAIAKDQEDF